VVQESGCPAQPSTKIASNNIFCAMSAGTTHDAAAMARSLGTARGGGSPGSAAPNGSRGTKTMS
jgi:hypothetical protein